MQNIDLVVKDAITARQEGRMDEALRMLMELWDEADRGRTRAGASEFMVMFEWEQLAAEYVPARDALAALRDEQARRLLSGDEHSSTDDSGPRRDRFVLIAGINEKINDSRATYELFLQLDSQLPAVARRAARRALPAIVAAGDFTLAERYMPDPLDLQDHQALLNRLAGDLALFPTTPRSAPRLASELSNFTRSVRLRSAVLDGLGRTLEAKELRYQALAGLRSGEMRALALREFDVPGTIISELVDRQMRVENTGNWTTPTGVRSA